MIMASFVLVARALGGIPRHVLYLTTYNTVSLTEVRYQKTLRKSDGPPRRKRPRPHVGSSSII